MHLQVPGVDYRKHGQTNYEFEHQAACGYVRKYVTRDKKIVECKYCLNVMKKSSK